MLAKLQKIGLTEKEAIIYQDLVMHGQSKANDIAKRTSSQRTVTYNILQQLVNKGFINYIIKNKKRMFSISRPETILSAIKEKEHIAKELISEIEKIKTTTTTSSKVEIYEGIEGMRLIYEDIRNAKNLKVINATGLIFEKLEYSANHIVKDMNRGKLQVIGVQSMKNTPLAHFKKQEVKYLPKNAENYATTFIYEGKIIIQVAKEKPFIIKIEDKDISEGYANDFDVLWEKL
jgi:sugar-specific transcriptional regulator TrmB